MRALHLWVQAAPESRRRDQIRGYRKRTVKGRVGGAAAEATELPTEWLCTWLDPIRFVAQNGLFQIAIVERSLGSLEFKYRLTLTMKSSISSALR